MVKKHLLLVLLLYAALIARAQVKCFVQTQMDRSTVYAQQPFKITISVLTATWYTAPLEFDNLQIPNAFIMPFDKTVPGIFTINGQNYAGLTFYYIVFPYKEGHYTLPPINIVATTPPVGDSKAQRINVKMQALSYIVKPVPKNFSSDNWFVAKDVSIEQRWSRSLSRLKVGDVVTRTITINARGTLPQFIPELKTDSLSWGSVYPQPSTLTDTRDEYDANGQRIQSVTYLLEKEGNFTFPQATIEWFNPINSRVYKRNTPVVKIHVATNPNLGILKTAKDSLKATLPVKTTINVKKGPYLIYGILWYYFALYSLAALCVLYFVVRMLIKFGKWLSNQYKVYLTSERYWFGKFNRSSAEHSTLLRNLYKWWDHFPVKHTASIQENAREGNAADIDEELAAYYKQQYADESANNKSAEFKRNIRKYRAALMSIDPSKADKHISTSQTEWE
ncbi:BatD family protein [Mucilaginibacter sp. X4EP1]|uniref:BatD family protein n=1 Tax=Mucilaginibacter sp. X4EP1 TaxID=2723092 RepID=UPI0021687AF4|nr:BatD family protein [Mucilaginibacter sp. X4EP1]MCS3813576.1 hypothetical protein [Mucilaginibacter sp. X4EP1]